MSRRVLVPYDQSEQADYALDHAMKTFESATVVLFHVVDPFVDHTGASGYETPQYPQLRETAEEMLDGVREEYNGGRIETVVRYGRPAHAILGYLDEDRIDHIVMGSHGRDGATRLLLGSVAETTARRSPVPVTVVRNEPEWDGEPNHVLVPFDGSAPAGLALEHALNQFDAADITALYVAYPPTERARETGAGFELLENWEEERDDHARSVLSGAEEMAADYGRSIETRSTTGKPAAAIVEYAREADVDHLVIGSTGRDGLSRLLLGSVAETVMRRSPVTVTIAK